MHRITTLVPTFALALALAACGGGESDFTATDAEGIAAAIDGAIAEDSPVKGVITADAFTPADVDEFNDLAKEACDEISDSGMSDDDVAEFTAGMTEGAAGLEDVLDVEALAIGLIDATCPANTATIRDALAG